MRFKKCVSFFCVFFAMMMMRVSVGSARSTRSSTSAAAAETVFSSTKQREKEKSSFEDFQEERRRKRGKTRSWWCGFFCSFVLSSLLSFLISAIVVVFFSSSFSIYTHKIRAWMWIQRKTNDVRKRQKKKKQQQQQQQNLLKVYPKKSNSRYRFRRTCGATRAARYRTGWWKRRAKRNENTGKGSFLLLSTTTTRRINDCDRISTRKVSNGRVKTKNIGENTTASRTGRTGITIWTDPGWRSYRKRCTKGRRWRWKRRRIEEAGFGRIDCESCANRWCTAGRF